MSEIKYDMDKIEVRFGDLNLVGAGWIDFELKPPPDPDEPYRHVAVENLWKSALSELNIRHPDPRVCVETSVYWYSDRANPQMAITFKMTNLTDTSNGDKLIGGDSGFGHRGVPRGWPGREVAQQYICALWGLYLLHEAQELVTLRGTRGRAYVTRVGDDYERRVAERPVIDAHDELGCNQRALTRSFSVAETLDWGLGFGQGQLAVQAARFVAEKELRNEIDFVAGRVAIWQ